MVVLRFWDLGFNFAFKLRTWRRGGESQGKKRGVDFVSEEKRHFVRQCHRVCEDVENKFEIRECIRVFVRSMVEEYKKMNVE